MVQEEVVVVKEGEAVLKTILNKNNKKMKIHTVKCLSNGAI